MTTLEAVKILNKEASINLNGLTIHVRIIDTKTVYGRDRFLVIPLQGEGEIWVENLRIRN